MIGSSAVVFAALGVALLLLWLSRRESRMTEFRRLLAELSGRVDESEESARRARDRVS